jgi:hypothetical protein
MSEIQVKLRRPHAGQKQVMREAKRFNVLMCGRGFGKTILGEIIGEKAALKPLPVGWFAPTYKVLDGAWRSIEKTLAPIILSKSKADKRIALMGGGEIEFWTLQDEDAGRSRRYGRVVIDEAGLVSGLKDKWDAAIRPTLALHQGDAWFLGTPKGQGDFYHFFLRGQTGSPNWASWQRGSADNPYLSKEDIELARQELPDEVFKQEYLGIPADNAGNPFGLSFIKACLMPGQLSTPFEYIGPGVPVAWGLDLARKHDWTVLIAIDKDGLVCRFYRFQKPWPEAIRLIREKVGSTPCLVDATGLGDPILSQLQEGGRVNYVGFIFTSASKQELIQALVLAVQKAEVRYPDGVIKNELDSFGYEYTKTGVRYNAPQGLHDDCVCALALAWKHRSAPLYTTGAIMEDLF